MNKKSVVAISWEADIYRERMQSLDLFIEEKTVRDDAAKTLVRDIRAAMIVWGRQRERFVFMTTQAIRAHLAMQYPIVIDRKNRPCVQGIELIVDY